MMSFKSIAAGGASGCADYFESEAAQNRDDYYAAEGDAGHWLGGHAEALGLSGAIQPGQLRALLEGFNPITGEPIVANAGEQHKCGWDNAFSAPKSVSLAWALSGPATRAAIEAAQSKASGKALDYLSKHAFTTRDRSGPEPVTNLLAAAYQHGTSREGDPQLHTHVLIANMSPDGRALDFDSRHKMAAGAVYRSELAGELQKMGYQVERDKTSFRIAGLDPAAEKHFSTRRAQILAELEKTGFSSAKSAGFAALSTRSKKEIIDRDQQIESWRVAAAEIGLDAQKIEALRNQPAIEQEPMPTHDEMLAELTQQASTFTRPQLNAAIAVAAQGKLDAAGIAAYTKDMLANKELVWLQSDSPKHRSRNGSETRFTSREMLNIEKGLAEKSEARQNETTHATDPSKVIDAAQEASMAAGRSTRYGYGATPEQKLMLAHICSDAGAVKLVEGLAGTGKSFTLQIAKNAWESAGYRVIGAALAGKAAQGLQDGSGIKSQTLHSLLYELDSGKTKLAAKDVVVIDEAGMVGSRLMARILEHIHAAGAKAVLVGDSKQLQPIDAGGSFRALVQRLKAVFLIDITRQKNVIDQNVVRHFADGNAAAAIKSLDDRGLIKTNETRTGVAEHLVADWAAHRDLKDPGDSLMIAATRADTKMLNDLAREFMRSEHRLCNEHTVQTKGGALALAEGDRIIFRHNDKRLGVSNGQLATVERIDFDKKGEILVTAKIDNGQRVQFRPGTERGQYADIQHGYALTVHSSQSVTVGNVWAMLHDSMTDREWSYVAASRARDETKLFCTNDQREEIERQMSTSHQSDTSLDFKEITPEMAPEVTPEATPEAAAIEEEYEYEM